MRKTEWDHDPTTEEICDALKDIPAWPGSTKTLGKDYPEYILPIKQSQKIGSKFIDKWRPYVMVDGRVKMFNDAHSDAGETYTEQIISPQYDAPTTEAFGRFLIVAMRITSTLFGVREDMSLANTIQVGTDARNPDATKPIENAMTSVRGRVIAAFGVGIIPLGGLASAEEVQTAMASVPDTDDVVRAPVKNENPFEEEQTPHPENRSRRMNIRGSSSVKPSEDSGSESQSDVTAKKNEENIEKALKAAPEGTTREQLFAAHRGLYPDLPEDEDEWKAIDYIRMMKTAIDMKKAAEE